MVLEQRPEMSRDPLVIGELNAKNIFVVEKFDVPDPTAAADDNKKKPPKPK